MLSSGSDRIGCSIPQSGKIFRSARRGGDSAHSGRQGHYAATKPLSSGGQGVAQCSEQNGHLLTLFSWMRRPACTLLNPRATAHVHQQRPRIDPRVTGMLRGARINATTRGSRYRSADRHDTAVRRIQCNRWISVKVRSGQRRACARNRRCSQSGSHTNSISTNTAHTKTIACIH